MKAVIMAGGEGSRLRPLTCDRPKPMVPVMNRPLMEYNVELLREHGFDDIAVTLQYLPEQIKDHFGDGSAFGVNLRYYVEDEPLGTAGSVKNAAAFLDETFIVVSGDALTDFNLTEALAFHRRRGALATLVLKTVDSPLEFGVVMTDDDGRIERFLEKPGWGEIFSDTVNTGIYILEPEVLDLIEPGQAYDFSKDLFPKLLAAGEPLFGVVLDGFWCDIGSISEYCRAHRQILQGKVRLNLRGSEVEEGIWMEEGVTVQPRARLVPPLYLGKGVYIGNGAVVAEESVLGSYTRVEERASLKRGITWEGSLLGRGASLRGGILCNAARLMPRAAVYEEAVVGDGSVVEEGAVIKPGVKVWPEKTVESGVVLRDSLIWGEKAIRSFFGRDGVRGEINLSLTPEMAVRLGAAFGSMLQGGPVVAGFYGGPPCRLIIEAVTAGLLSTGAMVLDGGELLMPMVRRAVGHLGARGGVHVVPCAGEGAGDGGVRLRFFDAQGLPLSKGEERKLQQLYYREDFHRPSGGQVGEAVHLPGLDRLYRRDLLNRISGDVIARAGLRVVLGSPSPYLSRFLVPLLQGLGCTVITLNPGDTAEPHNGYRSPRHRCGELVNAVRNNHATLGVILEEGGGRAFFFDERGRAVEGDLHTALLSLLIFRERRGGTVAVPVNTSQAVEELAERYHGRVLRTKADPRNLLEEEEQNCPEAASLNFDGVAALVYLLDFLAVHELTFSRLLEEIPAIRVREREIPCPWSLKGRVMRRLIEESAGVKREMIDGLKIYHPQGWALIMPDPEKPAYRVYGEGYSEEISASLTEFYVDRISLLQREE